MSNVTPASEWQRGTVETTELTLPSGKVCLTKKPESMQTFLAKGMIPNSLMPIIEKALEEGKTGKAPDPKDVMEEVLKDPSQIAAMFELIDAIVVDCVISPKVMPEPKWTDADLQAGRCQPTEVGQLIEDERRPTGDFIWIDWVKVDDRMHIFQWAVGGTRDLEGFRSQQAAALASVESGEGVEVPAI